MKSQNKNIDQIGVLAKQASKDLAKIPSSQKNDALKAMAAFILEDNKYILEANKIDLENAKFKKMPESFIDRLMLNEDRIESIANTLKEIESFEDPVGKIIDSWERPNGLNISRVSTPLGVIGIITRAGLM